MNRINKIRNLRILNKKFSKILSIFCVFTFTYISLNAQSTSQNFPTPITSNEINGTIRARDIGDARLTSYFYTFNGNQGDVFINVVTNNFNGDIDIFNAENLNPLTKIVVYADSSNNETGRVVYLRKPERLILRIQGRTPNDEPATYTIKFAGSFQPVSTVAEIEQPKPPEVKAESQSDVIVNSVGTIIGVKPKPTPTPTETASQVEEARKAEAEEKEIKENTAERKAETPTEEKTEPEKKVEVVVTENIPTQENPEKAERTEKTEAEAKTEAPPPARTRTRGRSANRRTRPEPTPPAPNPLESVRLIILFKDGSKIERPMSEVTRVNVDNKGVLTVVSKDGTIGRYSILDIAKMSIE